MDTISLTTPAMYADHHVIEVRQILLGLPGVKEVYASSAFHVVQVTFDPGQTSPEAITGALEAAGYLQDLDIPLETGAVAYGQNGGNVFFRHTTAYEQTQKTVGFVQETRNIGRPLWPCPGLGPIRRADDN